MLQSPQTPRDWERYYDVRWQLLHAPWHQPRGTERDEWDDRAHHVMWCVRPGVPIGVGRVHLPAPGEAHVAHLAVLDAWRGTGIGRELLEALEAEAIRRGAECVRLEARTKSVPFFKSLGYEALGPGPLLYGAIPHLLMRRWLVPNAAGMHPADAR